MEPLNDHRLTLILAATFDNQVAYFDKKNPRQGSGFDLAALGPAGVREAVIVALDNPNYLDADVRELPGSGRRIVLAKHKESGATCLAYPTSLAETMVSDINFAARKRLGPLTSWRIAKETSGVWPLVGVALAAIAVWLWWLASDLPSLGPSFSGNDRVRLSIQIFQNMWLIPFLAAIVSWLWWPLSRTFEQRRIKAAMSYLPLSPRLYGDPTGSAA